MIASARRGDIQQAPSFGVLLEVFVLLLPFPAFRLELADLQPSPAAGVVDDALSSRKTVGKEVCDDDDRILQALGFVDGDDLNAGADGLADRGIALRLAAGFLVLEKPDE